VNEFELIERMRARSARGATPGVAGVDRSGGGAGDRILLGSGDDCALLRPRAGRVLAVSVDTAVAGVHVPADPDPYLLGWRATAAALSDLAAMGAEPLALLIALTLPPERARGPWADALADGVAALLARTGGTVVGGDLTRGPLAFSCTVLGDVPADLALRRSGARPGDRVFVTGALGGAAAALALELTGGAVPGSGPERALHARYAFPEPRLAFGAAVRDLATAAIDVSDGLLADAGHLARAGAVDLHLRAGDVPAQREAALRLGPERARELALTGGEDYELLGCVPPEHLAELRARAAALDLPLTVIGTVAPGPGRVFLDGRPRQGDGGFDHFAGGNPS
jgi:thiamine-monophosphate kinase